MIIFTNQASLSYNNTVTTSNTTTGQIVTALSIAKTALRDEYSVNDSITYVVSIVNSSSNVYSNLTVTDSLGAYTVPEASTVYPLRYVADSVRLFVNGVLQATPTVTDETPLVIRGIDIPAGGNALIIYETTVTQFAPLAPGGAITNEAVITGVGVTTPITATETVRVANEPMLTITKELSPTVVPENGEITYTFVIRNYGNTPAVATDNAVITDIFDPILNNISVEFNGDTWVSPTNYTYNTVTGAFVTVAGEITVPAATFTQNPTTGEWSVVPGVSVLTVMGTI